MGATAGFLLGVLGVLAAPAAADEAEVEEVDGRGVADLAAAAVGVALVSSYHMAPDISDPNRSPDTQEALDE